MRVMGLGARVIGVALCQKALNVYAPLPFPSADGFLDSACWLTSEVALDPTFTFVRLSDSVTVTQCHIMFWLNIFKHIKGHSAPHVSTAGPEGYPRVLNYSIF